MGANDPIRVATTPLSAQLVSVLTRALDLSLADRSGGEILQDPNFASGFEDWEALGQLGDVRSYVDWGTVKFQDVGEGSDATVYTLADSQSTLTRARRAFARQVSDRARHYDAWGVTDWVNFLRDAQWGFNQKIIDLVAALQSSVSATGGNSGGKCTWGVIMDDMQTLATAKCPGPYTLITRTKDWGNAERDALALGGAIQMDPNTLAMMRVAGYGYQGTYMGGQLRVYCTDELDTSVGDTVSLMFGRRFLRWGARSVAPSPAEIPLLVTPMWKTEISRVVLKNEDQIVSSTEAGVAIGLNACAIKQLYLT